MGFLIDTSLWIAVEPGRLSAADQALERKFTLLTGRLSAGLALRQSVRVIPSVQSGKRAA